LIGPDYRATWGKGKRGGRAEAGFKVPKKTCGGQSKRSPTLIHESGGGAFSNQQIWGVIRSIYMGCFSLGDQVGEGAEFQLKYKADSSRRENAVRIQTRGQPVSVSRFHKMKTSSRKELCFFSGQAEKSHREGRTRRVIEKKEKGVGGEVNEVVHTLDHLTVQERIRGGEMLVGEKIHGA